MTDNDTEGAEDLAIIFLSEDRWRTLSTGSLGGPLGRLEQSK